MVPHPSCAHPTAHAGHHACAHAQDVCVYNEVLRQNAAYEAGRIRTVDTEEGLQAALEGATRGDVGLVSRGGGEDWPEARGLAGGVLIENVERRVADREGGSARKEPQRGSGSVGRFLSGKWRQLWGGSRVRVLCWRQRVH